MEAAKAALEAKQKEKVIINRCSGIQSVEASCVFISDFLLVHCTQLPGYCRADPV